MIHVKILEHEDKQGRMRPHECLEKDECPALKKFTTPHGDAWSIPYLRFIHTLKQANENVKRECKSLILWSTDRSTISLSIIDGSLRGAEQRQALRLKFTLCYVSKLHSGWKALSIVYKICNVYYRQRLLPKI